MRQRLEEAIHRFRQGRVLVVGDVAIDEMVYGVTERLSREAPVVILGHRRTDILLGAAGNAAHNLAALQAKHTAIVGVLGTDYYAGQLRDALVRDGIDASGMVADDSRPTTTKTRISGTANHSVTQQIVRIDRESRDPVSGLVETRLLEQMTRFAPDMDALLLSDYGLGVMTDAVIAEAQALARRYNLVLAVDSQKALSQFQQATVVTPNQPEAENNVGFALNTSASVLAGGRELLRQTNAENVLITRGQDGMVLFERSGRYTEIPVFNRSEVFDVTGAGDTVIATLTLARATGAEITDAAILGNLAASLVVKRFGAAVTQPAELQDAMKQLDPALLDSIKYRHPLPEATQTVV
jgi:rfaE bifunctional protein kinase chain/domain